MSPKAKSTQNQIISRIPIVIISGFLGAGKTTLLKNILAWDINPPNTVVLVNEFGDVGIDGSLLKNQGADIVELTSGCICCTLSNDLKDSLIRISKKLNPSRVFLETSGIADPTSVISIIQESELSERYIIDNIITVLDADYWKSREVFGPLFQNQLDMAHLILLNKTDLFKKETVKKYLKEIHELLPNSRVIPTQHCKVDPDTLFFKPELRAVEINPMDFFRSVRQNHGAQKSVDTSGYTSFLFQSRKMIDENRFGQFIKRLPWEVFRMKGSVQFQDRHAFINYIGGKMSWDDWAGGAESRLVFIGWDVDAEIIIKRLETCVID